MPLPRTPYALVLVIIAVFIFALALLAPTTVRAAAPTASCSFNTFSAPTGYSLSAVNGVTDEGTVVGQLLDNSTQQMIGFSYSAKGVFTRYAAPKSVSTWLYGGNGSGVNAGSYQASVYPDGMHGFLLQGSQFAAVNYPKAANTWLFDVNQLGAAVGSFSASQTLTKGFLLVNGKYTTIAYPNAPITYAQAINDNGVIVGSYIVGSVSTGFIWEDGKFTLVSYPKAKYGTSLVGVNNSGVVAGNQFAGDFGYGFIYENGVFKNVVYPGAKFATVGGINNNGLVSGQIFFTLTNTLGYTAICK
jgi:hypothetical protein